MKRKRKQTPVIKREDLEKLNQSVIDQQCAFLSKLNKSISRKLKGKKVHLLARDDDGDKIQEARIVHAYIEGDRLIVLDVEFEDKRVLVDFTYLSSND